jgi:DNA-binding protein H-NS
LAKLGHLEAVLGALAGAKSDGKVELTANEKVSVAVIRDIAGWTSEANELLAAAKKPRLVPLVLAIDQQKLVIQGIEAAQAGKKKRRDALQQQFTAVENEVLALAAIREALDKDPSWNAKSLNVLVAETKEKDKARLLRALAVYADDVKRFRAEADVWSGRAMAAQYMEGLTRAKHAAAQWDGLSDSIATVLADYHAAGVKTGEIAEFFKALGLLSIGAGVTK